MSNTIKILVALFAVVLLGISIPYSAADTSLKQSVVWEVQKYYPDNNFTITMEAPGHVKINGQVKSYWDKRNVYGIITRVPGVTEILDELVVNTDILPNDVIKANFERDLQYNKAIIEPGKIKAAVDNGEVILKGTVSFQREADIAEDIASWQPGVKGVVNEISVLPPGVAMSDQNLREIITTMIHRDFPMLHGIQETVNGGKVTLTGKVPRMTDKYWLGKEVKRIHGVRSVDNNVMVDGNM